jgi:uncharacterized membrane-anchored protein YhcB (DUF1043 family)
MALTGALQADFSDFVSEATKASAALGVMDAEAKKTGATLAKTGAEVDGVGKKTSGLTDLSKGLRLVDQSANAMGVSLSKPIAAIEEISQVSGKSAKELGALGTAGAVAGAALAGWQVGRWIADITGADAAIGKLTASLLGFGDVAAQEAGAKADVLAQASKNAGRQITDMTEAIKINYDAVKAGTAAVDTAIHRQADWEREIRKHRAELPEITAALANHTATVAQLEKQYGMSAEAITFYVAKTKDQTAAQEEATRKTEAAAAAQEKLRASMFGTDSITKAQEYQAALGGVGNLTRMTQEEQTKLNTVLGEAIAAYTRTGEIAPQAMRDLYNATVSIGPVVTGLGAEFASIGTKFTVTADAIVADIGRMKAETAAYEAETQSMAQAWQQVPPPVKESTASVERLSVAMSSAVHQTDSLFEKLQAGKALFESYQAAGVATGSQIGLDPYNFRNQQRTLLPTMSSTGNTLNVNVNSTEAGNISTALVNEMRRQGVRF